jgi:hypothetical protein
MILGNITTFTECIRTMAAWTLQISCSTRLKRGGGANKRPVVVFRDTNIAYISKTLAGQEMAAFGQNSCPNASYRRKNHSFLSALHIAID